MPLLFRPLVHPVHGAAAGPDGIWEEDIVSCARHGYPGTCSCTRDLGVGFVNLLLGRGDRGRISLGPPDGNDFVVRERCKKVERGATRDSLH